MNNNYAKSFTASQIAGSISPLMLNERYCRDTILELLHGNNPKCPRCSELISLQQLHGFCELRRVRCYNCGAFFTAYTGTFLSGSQLSPTQIILIAIFLELGLSNTEIAKYSDLSTETIRLWRNKFKVIERIGE